MPAAFDKCVKAGGRVRTKKLPGNKYMHVCFLDGKSYAGEIKVRQKEDDSDYLKHPLLDEGGELMKKKNNNALEKFNESLTFPLSEKSLDEEKGTVEICVLAPCISKNNRYYSPKIVEKAYEQMKARNLKAFAGHDNRNPANIVATFDRRTVRMEGGKLFARAKFSKAKDIAESILTRIKEEIVTDTSIAAMGHTRRMKMGDQYVNAVQEKGFNLSSVDFVSEGGVDTSKVTRVFEENNIPNIQEVENMKIIENVQQLREEYPDLVKSIESQLKKQLDEATKAKEKAEGELAEMKLVSFKTKKIQALDLTDELKKLVSERATGNTEDELTASINKEAEYIRSIAEATKGKAVVDGVPERKKQDKKQESMTSESIRNDSRIPEQYKGQAIEILWDEGTEKVKSFLKDRGIEL